jgi:predicted GNAT family N-acyltransferase
MSLDTMSVEARTDYYYQTCLEDGTVVDYEIRGLNHGDDEIAEWAQFCASVFRDKPHPPPASYFENHYYNDPLRFPQLIRVARVRGGKNPNTIVASCRLFLRTLSENVSAGGIGEVCTAAEHRRRGLSNMLLRNVLDIMKERKLSVSLLHAAPAFFPLYESVGYVSSRSEWSILSISRAKLQKFAAEQSTYRSPLRIRDATFPDDTDRLHSIHQIFSEQRFAGCIVRSKEYWNKYLSVEMKGSLFVLEESDIVIAWLSLRQRGDRIQLREFGYDDASSDGIGLDRALFLLLAQALKRVENVSDNDWTLAFPTFLVDACHKEYLSFVEWESIRREDDLGWMYKILDNSITIEDMNGSKRPHLIWPVDSF